jgi:hypothetical protein
MFVNQHGARVSDNKKVVVAGQNLYAKQELIEAANNELERINSRVRLQRVPGAEQYISFDLQGHGDNFSQYLPRWVAETVRTSNHIPLNKLNETVTYTRNPGDSYITWSDCHKNSQTVMGATGDRGTNCEPEQPLIRLLESDTQKTALLPPMAGGQNGQEFVAAQYKDQHAFRGAYAVLNKIIPTSDARADHFAALDRHNVPIVDARKVSFLWKDYAEEMTKMAGVAEMRTAALNWQLKHWINAFVHPAVGEGLCMMPPKSVPGFISTYAWNDLRAMFADDADVWEALGLDPNSAAPTHAQLQKALVRIEPPTYFDLSKRYPEQLRERDITQDSPQADLERAQNEIERGRPGTMTSVQKTLVRDRFIRRYVSRQLKAASCTLERKAALIRDLDEGTDLATILGGLSKAELLYMFKNNIINRNHTGKQRDALTLESIETQTGAEWLGELRPAALVWKDPWNFHWAGVVLLDGHDFVTLENLSVEAEDHPNRKWYFQMYRTLDALDEYDRYYAQTFHGDNERGGGFGDLSLTLCFKFVPPPPRATLNMLRTQTGSPSRATLAIPLPPPSTAPVAASGGGEHH